MPVTLFKDTTYNLIGLIESIKRGEIQLPDIQRPFVWEGRKVRDLFDSMYKGFPVGYLLFWGTGAEVGARKIGTNAKETPPRLLIVDGQQRLTSLFAVMTGTSVVRKDYSEAQIRVAFRPMDQRFEVNDAAVEKDPEFLPDITSVWVSYRDSVRRFMTRLREHRGGELPSTEEDKLEEAIDRVRDLQHYPFKAVELDATVEEDRVAEIFVRINSEGVTLNQADFILTLMSVWDDEGRRKLEQFSRTARQPSASGPSSFNHFVDPAPAQMLRSSVGLGFRRARLQNVYSILRGKDLETGLVTAERREQQFATLRAAQDAALDLTNWHEFLKCLGQAGFRSARMITSESAVFYTYVFWLVGREDLAIPLPALRDVIARWFFMAHTTGRYTSSPESQMESDLARIRDVKDASAFVTRLDREIATAFTADYWNISLPNRLDTSAAKSPALTAYWAALNLLEADVLFSNAKVSSRMDPAIKAPRDLERHHLFPKAYLSKVGVSGPARTNQIANMAFVDWNDNADISARPPLEYWPSLTKEIDPQRLVKQMYWHALPKGWEQLPYDEFLLRRRKLIAEVVRDAFTHLQSGNAPPKYAAPTVSELIASGESLTVEFKSSLRWSYNGNIADPRLEAVILKTIAGFMNAEGGALLIGVSDAGAVLGLEPDFLAIPGKHNRDGYELYLSQLIEGGLGRAQLTLVRTSFSSIDGKEVCRLDVAASAKPVFLKVQGGKDFSEFWTRMGNSTRTLVGSEMVEFQRAHWGEA